MVSQGLVGGGGSQPITVNSANPVKDAYDRTSQQLQQQRDQDVARQRETLQFEQQQQDRKDNEILKVFEFAGDGYIEEAKYLAQSRGLEVPPEVFTNGTLAKGLAMAGKIYPNDPSAAQKFTNAWMSTQGDLNTRMMAGQQAAGQAVNPEDRQLQKQIAFEKWKMDNRVGTNKRDIRTVDGQLVEVTDNGVEYLTQKQPDNSDRVNFVRSNLSSYLSGSLQQPTEEDIQRNTELFNKQYDILTQPQAPQLPQAPVVTQQQQQLPNGLPQGSVYIGTSGGRPVYQAPNGDRFIDDGNP